MKYAALLSCSRSSSSLISLLVCAHENVAHFGSRFDASPESTAVTIEPDDRRHSHDSSTGHSQRVKGTSTPTNRATAPSEVSATASSSLPTSIRDTDGSQRSVQPRAHWLYRFYKALPAGVRKAAFREFYRRNTGVLKALEKTGPYTTCYDTSRNLSRIELLRTVLPEVKIVHVMKNPYEFIAANISRHNRSHTRLLDDWLRYNEAAMAYERILGSEHYLKIHFENFLQSPVESAQKLYSFLLLEPPVTETDDSIEPDRIPLFAHCSEETNAYVRVEAQPQTWKKVLSKEQIHYIDRAIVKHDWALAVP